MPELVKVQRKARKHWTFHGMSEQDLDFKKLLRTILKTRGGKEMISALALVFKKRFFSPPGEINIYIPALRVNRD